MLERLLWICLAGAAGTGVRYVIGVWALSRWGDGFPLGTLLVNVMGCFLIALVLETALRSATLPPTLRLALTTGFTGGLTTYSTFAYETSSLYGRGQHALALANLGLTLVACFVAILLGGYVARAFG